MKSLLRRLQAIHSALDDACGDSDIDYLSDRDLRQEYPAQWAACKLAGVIAALEKKVVAKTSTNTGMAGAEPPQICPCCNDAPCPACGGSGKLHHA